MKKQLSIIFVALLLCLSHFSVHAFDISWVENTG